MKNLYEEDKIILKEKELRGNVIIRQELRTLTPICNSKCALICYSVLFLLYLIFGLLIICSPDVTEITNDYTNWYIRVNIVI